MSNPKFIEARAQLEKLVPVVAAPIKKQVFVCSGKSEHLERRNVVERLSLIEKIGKQD